MSKKGRVLVAMSGGIDSTISAILLHEEGYEVIGITMKTWDYASSGGNRKETGCCSLDSINDARQASVQLDFPHYIIDIREEFGDFVINNFVDEYLAGRTPNPCVLCNTHIKWEALLKRADAMNCDFIATGHYATLREERGRYFVSESKDRNKDQTYALWGVSQQCLKRTLFPIGNYTKPEVREIACSLGFRDLAGKSESYEICFVPDNDYRGFLKRKVEGLDELAGGRFVNESGNVMGQHEGYPFYTIGQRKGLGIATGEAVYVKEIIPSTNTIVLGDESSLQRNGMWIDNINLQKYDAIPEGIEARIKVRYNHTGAKGQLSQIGQRIKTVFHNKVKAIAPGQSAVFYEGKDLLGGGIIRSSFNMN